jgi:hypothetical protein
MPNKVTEEEVNSFLENKLNLQLATIDEDGYPSIQQSGFYMTKNQANSTYQLKKLQERHAIYTKILTRSTSLLTMRTFHIKG